MKQKLLFMLNLVLICAMGLGVSASRLTGRPSRPTTTTTETSLRSLKAANPTNQNRLTADNRDQLVTEVENLKKQLTELSSTVAKINITWTNERGFILRMTSQYDKYHPSCDGTLLRQWEHSGNSGVFGWGAPRRSTSCYVNIDPEWKVVRVGNPCAVQPVVTRQNGSDGILKYQKWTIDITGKCSNLSEVTRNFSDWEYSISE